MDKKRVVVTGLGALTPLGNDVETTWKNAVAGVSGVGPITRVDSSEYTAKVAAELKDFNIEDYMVLADLKHSKSNSKCIRIKEQDA